MSFMPQKENKEIFSNWQNYPCVLGKTGTRKWYIRTYGQIPLKSFVLHFCDQPNCRQIEHIWLGSQSDNMKDRAIKGRNCSQTEEIKKLISLTLRRIDYKSVEAIRKFPNISNSDWSRGLEVTTMTIWKIRTGRTYV